MWVRYNLSVVKGDMKYPNLVDRFFTYQGETRVNTNLKFALIEAIFLGIIFTADPYLSVFLVRMGANSFQVSLLSSMPAISGLLLVMFIGRYLQSQKNILPWYSTPRVFSTLAYLLTGLMPFVFSGQSLIVAVLAVWALATIPQTIIMVSFTVVMGMISDGNHRFELMSRRWAVLAGVSALLLVGIGFFLDTVQSPLNYQIVFMALSMGVIGATYYNRKLKLPDNEPSDKPSALPIAGQVKQYGSLLKENPPFTRFILKRLIYQFGWTFAFPIYPLYYVHEVHASDTWVGFFSTVSTVVVVIGYFFWLRESRRRSNHVLLGWTTFGTGIFPILFAATTRPELIALIVGFGALFQSGMDLVFFDELMKTVPRKSHILYVSLAQSAQYLATIAGPFAGSFVASQFGLVPALLASGTIRLIGFALFFFTPSVQPLFEEAPSTMPEPAEVETLPELPAEESYGTPQAATLPSQNDASSSLPSSENDN